MSSAVSPLPPCRLSLGCPIRISRSGKTTAPTTVINHAYDTALTAEENGANLWVAMHNLQPGEGLAIAAGTYSVVAKIDLRINGTAAQPIWIYGADPQNRPVITRPNAGQNTFNIGEGGACSYLCVRDIELTGGSDLMRINDCHNVWIDRCYLHDGGGAGLAAFSPRHVASLHHSQRNHSAGAGRPSWRGHVFRRQ